MPLTADWSVADGGVASIKDMPPNMARLTGKGGGTTNVIVTSVLGDDFSFNVPVNVKSLSGQWQTTENGEQTCKISDYEITETDSGTGPVQITVPIPDCDRISFDVGFPGVENPTGTLTKTGSMATPFDFHLQTNNSSGTLDCVIFTQTNGMDIEFGEPFCPEGAVCQALSCSESTTTNGSFYSAERPTGEATAESSWTFNASWLQTIDDETTTESASCSGESDIFFRK